jgi:hypothetical protein
LPDTHLPAGRMREARKLATQGAFVKRRSKRDVSGAAGDRTPQLTLILARTRTRCVQERIAAAAN